MRKFLENFILRDINTLDIETGIFKKNHVYIKEGAIHNVTPSLDLSDGFQEINCKNKFLIPGIIDIHVNILSTFDSNKVKNVSPAQIKKNLNKAVQSGVTCMRDMYAPLNLVSSIKAQIDKYNNSGKKLYFSASLSDETDDFFLSYRRSLIHRFENISTKLGSNAMANRNVKFNREMDNSQLESYVWNLVETGLDAIRVGNGFSRLLENMSLPALLENEKLSLIINNAHKYNKKVSVNINYLEDLKRVINLRISSIEGSITDQLIDNETLNKIKEKEIYISPLINIISSMLDLNKIKNEVETDSDNRFEKSVKNNILEQINKIQKDQKLMNFIKKSYENASVNLSRIIEHEIPIVMGSGAGDTFSFFGDYFAELEQYKKHGLSNIKILQSATIEGARLLGVEKETASIKAKNCADLLILKEDPLADLQNLKSIEVIFKNGKSYEPETING